MFHLFQEASFFRYCLRECSKYPDKLQRNNSCFFYLAKCQKLTNLFDFEFEFSLVTDTLHFNCSVIKACFHFFTQFDWFYCQYQNYKNTLFHLLCLE